MKAITKKQQEFLLDALKYYTPDPNARRCVAEDGTCNYNPVTVRKYPESKGCIIGRKISHKLQKELDVIGAISERKAFLKLPEDLRGLTQNFLRQCQNFHDTAYYWDDKGLSESGEGILLEIIEEFSFDKSLFEKYLNPEYA